MKKKGTLLPNAPFRIKVGANEVGDANKVKVSGPGTTSAVTQQFNDVILDTKEAGLFLLLKIIICIFLYEFSLSVRVVTVSFLGFGGLSVSLEGPSKAELNCQENKDGTIKLRYKPTEPGVYVLSVKFADHHVAGQFLSVRFPVVFEELKLLSISVLTFVFVCRKSVHGEVAWARGWEPCPRKYLGRRSNRRSSTRDKTAKFS